MDLSLNHFIELQILTVQSEVWGFQSGVVEDPSIVGCDAVPTGQ